MPDFSSPCLRLTLAAHALIEQWIGNADAPDDLLTRLLADFAPEFSMITPDGQRVPDGALPGLFAGLRGARPGLAIQIDELTVQQTSADSAVLSYRERHIWNGGETRRRSTAVFTAAPGGLPQWRHLHETWA